MPLYEFINPSDAITFRAQDDKTAFMAVTLLADGKAGCIKEDGTNLGTLLAFARDPDKMFSEMMGDKSDEWLEQNRRSLAECLDSFQCTSLAERKIYEMELEKITDYSEREKFRTMWEDKKATSLTRWVPAAWRYASAILRRAESPNR